MKILHRLAANPWIYEQIQFFFGGPVVNRRLRHLFRCLPQTGVCLDIGGGTGMLYRNVISSQPTDLRYVCLDQDYAKLRALRNDTPRQSAIIGDAGKLPVRSQSIKCAVGGCFPSHPPEPAGYGYRGRYAHS
jgi:ubiquinone/menaquinone biosynthesis C-methylase UbiE